MTIQRQPSLRRLDWHYMAMQIGFWAMFASIVGYQTALLLDRGPVHFGPPRRSHWKQI